MSRLDDLRRSLAAQGVELSITLKVSAPPGALTSEVKAELVRLKPALLVRLAREAQWAALSARRWGPALDDSEPGLVIDCPDLARMLSALRDADSADDYAVAERLAIQLEDVPVE